MEEGTYSETNIEDAWEDDDASGVSMVDILQEEEKLQEDANAVLGGSDDRNCTYLMGYVGRQALYSCRTCAVESSNGEMAGVCLACSLECHDGHDLIELYTKRNFRCDCGNSKFGEFKCKLCPNKLPCNPDNKYNHNYVGLYCSCSRPYPDPDESIEDEMIQCTVCEDWFHKKHLESCTVEDDFDEMTCSSCMDSCELLWYYAKLCNAFYGKKVPTTMPVPETTINVVDNEETGSCSVEKCNTVISCERILNGTATAWKESSLVNALKEFPEIATTEVCYLKGLGNKFTSELNRTGDVFWPENWRKRLCQCAKCMEMYTTLNILFLLDKNDTIAAYEECGKSKSCKSSYQQGLEALSNLDRIQQVDLIEEYNDLKSQLTEYLKKFAENKKVVRQEDIDEFFSQLAARKRQKTETPSLSYYCK